MVSGRHRVGVEPLGGGEQLTAMQLQDSVSHRVTIRYRTGVTAKMRVLHRGRALKLVAVTDADEDNHWLTLLCEEGAAV